MRRRDRSGASLLELTVALLLTALLLAGVARALIPLQRRVRATSTAMARAEVTRVLADRVGRAARTGGVAGEVLTPDGGLPIRSWRGRARWCGNGWIEVGVRAPAPGRDSVLWVDGFGRERWGLLDDRAPDGCDGEGRSLRLEIDGVEIEPRGGVVRWYERGRIRVDDAVRYGREGRPAQPLTAAVLSRSSGFVREGGRVRARLRWAERGRIPPSEMVWWPR